MRKHLIYFVLLIYFCLHQENTYWVSKKSVFVQSKQDIGIPMSQVDFDNLVSRLTDTMNKGEAIKGIGDYIALARLFNTIYYSELYKIEKYKNFVDLLTQKRYFPNMLKELKATPQTGLWDYSKEYDINIGGPQTKNSIFRIIK